MSGCRCEACQRACVNKPGWFMPGEAEKVAEYKGMSLHNLFSRHLAVDWWESEGDIPQTFVLAPGIDGWDVGSEYPGDPKGECEFFEDGLCTIYPVRPFECREFMHDEEKESVHAHHRVVAKAWVDHQGQIVALLEREPVAESFGLGDWLGGWRDSGTYKSRAERKEERDTALLVDHGQRGRSKMWK